MTVKHGRAIQLVKMIIEALYFNFTICDPNSQVNLMKEISNLTHSKLTRSNFFMIRVC